MQIIADVSKISKTVQRNLNFILNVLWEYRIHFTQLSIVLAEKNILFSHKMVFTENEAVTKFNYAGTCNGINVQLQSSE